MEPDKTSQRVPIRELVRYYLRLGLLGFGGPVALVLHSCYRLTKLGMKDWLEWALAAAAFGITVAVQTEVALVFIGCGIVGLLYYGSLVRGRTTASTTSLMIGMPLVAIGPPAGGLGAMLDKLLTFFLKAGSLTFGSGLVIVPFLEKGL